MAASKITYPTKSIGDYFYHGEANEIKNVVNQHADEIDGIKQGIPVVAQSNTTVSIDPNVLNVWSSALSSLTISFNAGATGKMSEYMLEFTAGANFTLTLPSGVRWVNTPEWVQGSTYHVSILDNLALSAGWEAAGS